MTYWGFDYQGDYGGCNLAIDDPKVIEDFITELVEKIDMVAYGPPRIVRFGSGDKEGYTLDQLIETSNITCHFVPAINAAFLTVFSCKEFDPDIVDICFKKYFAFNAVRSHFRERFVPET
jgi:S-adenosylmethionine/arginine decarboxylase-like enzyme